MSLYARKNGIELRVISRDSEKGLFTGETVPKAPMNGRPDYTKSKNASTTIMSNLKISEWYFFDFC